MTPKTEPATLASVSSLFNASLGPVSPRSGAFSLWKTHGMMDATRKTRRETVDHTVVDGGSFSAGGARAEPTERTMSENEEGGAVTPREHRVRRQALSSTSATALAVQACPRIVYRGDPVSTLKIIDVGSPMFVEFSPNGEIRQSWLYRRGYLCAAEMPIGEYHMHDAFEHAGETLAVLGREVWAFPGRMQ